MLLPLVLVLAHVAAPPPALPSSATACATPKAFTERLQKLKHPLFKRDSPGLPNPWTLLDLAWPYEALAHASGSHAAVAALVQAYGLSAPSATALLKGLLWVEPARENPWLPAPDALAHGVPCLVDAAAQAPGNVAPLAALLALSSQTRVTKEGLVQALSLSPDPLGVGMRLLRASGFFWRLPLATHLASLHPETLRSILEALGPAVRDSEWIPFLEAAQEALPLTATRDPLRQRTSELLLRALLEAQLPLEAARVYRSLPAWTRAELLAARWSTRTSSNGPDMQPTSSPPGDLRLELAGALLADRDVPAAREVFTAHSQTAASPADAMGRHRDCEASLQSTLLGALLGSEKPDPFTLFVRLKTCPPAEPFRSLAQPLLALRYRRVLAEPRTAKSANGAARPEDSDPVDHRFSAAGEAAYQAAQRREEERLAKVPSPPPEPPPVAAPTTSATATLIARQLASAVPTIFEERPAADCTGAQKGAIRTAPRGVPDGFEAVSAVKTSGGTVILALSQRLDPVGEVSAGAYWLLGVHGANAAPLYLGLRQYRPYDLPEKRTLPVVKGGRLYLLANVSKLDERSITFPPVALATTRKKEGVCLSAKLEDLQRDSDGDGLTDLVEARLLTDPQQKDSDGDGLGDAQDALPQVSSRGASLREAGPLSAFLVYLRWEADPQPGIIEPVDKHGLGVGQTVPTHFYDQAAIFLDAAPESLIGVDLPFRVIPLTGPLLKEAQSRFGAFYPLRVEVISNDAGDQAFIQWDERWRGGAAKAVRENGHWKFETLGNWIT